jgi:hypothetical protein
MPIKMKVSLSYSTCICITNKRKYTVVWNVTLFHPRNSYREICLSAEQEVNYSDPFPTPMESSKHETYLNRIKKFSSTL